MTLRALIVDDERLARRRMTQLLARHPDVEVAAEAHDVDSAAAALTADPTIALVFLDVQMPGGSGFELLARCARDVAVIFVTAFDEHALRAFEVNALDYLLKPVDPRHLARALSRVPASRPEVRRICLPLGVGARFVAPDEIACICAEGDYSEVCLRSGQRELVRITLRQWEQRLDPERFARVHRSAIVQRGAVVALHPARGSTYELQVEGMAEVLPVSRSQYRTVADWLGARS